jgi:hypothetical protein
MRDFKYFNNLRSISCLTILAWLAMAANASPSTPVSCSDNLSVPGKYVLESDLTCDKRLEINVSGVHLDLGGHTLSCSSPEQ